MGIEAKYASPIKVYKIRPTVGMTVEFDKNGRFFEMHISKLIEDASNPTIVPVIVKEIVNELVPVTKRGAKVDPVKLTHLEELLAAKNTQPVVTEEYENVTIIYMMRNFKESPGCSGTAAIIIKWKNRPVK